jgi:hypothetical protein
VNPLTASIRANIQDYQQRSSTIHDTVIVGLTRPPSNRLWRCGGWIEHHGLMLAFGNKTPSGPRAEKRGNLEGNYEYRG